MRRPIHSFCTPRRAPGGFTLVELLTVIGVIAILAAIVIPTVNTVEEHARQVKSSANLRSIGQAMGLYAHDNHGLLPAPQPGETSNVGRNAPGSPNPRGGTWMVELVTYLDGTLQYQEGTTQAAVVRWPDVLSCPQYLAVNNGISDPNQRGYGMNIYPFRPDPNNPNNNTPFPTQRQMLSALPNPANNIIVATSNDVTIEPNPDGTFIQNGPVYANGDPARFSSVGLYLTVDWSVHALTPDEAAKILMVQQAQNAAQ